MDETRTRMLTVARAAHRLHVTSDRLLGWVAEGQVQAMRRADGTFQIPASEIERIREASACRERR